MFNWYRKWKIRRKLRGLPPLPPKSAKQRAFETLVQSGDAFGMDLTAVKTVDDDGNEITHAEFMKVATDKLMGKGLSPSPKSWTIGYRIDFRPVDGMMQKYVNGIEEGDPFPATDFIEAQMVSEAYRAVNYMKDTQGD